MRDLLPQAIYERIRRQYRAVEPLAREDFEDLRAEEDSLTGAIATNMRRTLKGEADGFQWDTHVKKLRGRGPGALEHEVGADMIIELEVKDDAGDIVGRKSLLAQAKKQWSGSDRALLAQTRDMERTAPGAGIVIDYGPTGCATVIGSAVIHAEGNRRRLGPNAVRPIGERLGEEFLACSLGRRDMYYDANRQRIVLPGSGTVVAPRFAVDLRVRTTVTGGIRQR